jgi:hypothetical protein
VEHLPPEPFPSVVKLSALKGGASRQGSFIYIVPLDPALKSGVKGHVPINHGVVLNLVCNSLAFFPSV